MQTMQRPVLGLYLLRLKISVLGSGAAQLQETIRDHLRKSCLSRGEHINCALLALALFKRQKSFVVWEQ